MSLDSKVILDLRERPYKREIRGHRMPKVWGILLAREGSQRLPNKSLLPLAGRPLADYTIEAMLNCPELRKRWLFTDDTELLKRAKAQGLDIPPFKRPASVSEAATSSFQTLRYFLQQFPVSDHPELIVLLQLTSPLRTAEDISAALRQYEADTSCDYVLSVNTPLKPYHWSFQQHPDTGRLQRFTSPAEGDVVFPNGALSIFAPSVVLNSPTDDLFERTDITIKGYEMPWERSVDIDYPIDFQLAEVLVRQAAQAQAPQAASETTIELKLPAVRPTSLPARQ